MRCKQAQKLLPAMAAGELSGDKAEALEAHLRECPSCSKELEMYEESLSALRQSKDRSIPDDLWDGYWEKIRDEAVLPQTEGTRPIVVQWRSVVSFAAAAAVLVAVFVGMALLYRSHFSPTEPPEPEQPLVAHRDVKTPETPAVEPDNVVRVYPLADMAKITGARQARSAHCLPDSGTGSRATQHYTLRRVEAGDKKGKTIYEF